MNDLIFIICGIILLLTNNISFVLLFMPISYFYFYLKNRLKNAEKEHSNYVSEKKGNMCISFIRIYYEGFIRYYIYRVSIVPSHHIRNIIYKYILRMNMGRNVAIYSGAEIRDPQKITIGNGSIIGDNAILDGRNGITIGANVNFSSNVSIWSEQHDHRDPLFRCATQKKEKVIINDRVWVGPNSIILHSVTVGEGAVIAANSVVTKNVDPFTIVAGVPAKVIGTRNDNLIYNLDGVHLPFK